MKPHLIVFTMVVSLLLTGPASGDDLFQLLNVPSNQPSGTNWGTGLRTDERAALGQLNGNLSSASGQARYYSTVGRGIDVLIVGDGYTQAEYNRFVYLANRAAQAVFANPVVRAANATSKIRFWPWFVASAESGASSWGRGYRRNTAFNALFWDRWSGDTFISVDAQKAWNFARSLSGGQNVQYILVLVNAGQYAATNWASGVCVVSDFGQVNGSNSITFEDIVCHELLGHTISGLWDEYVYNSVPDSNLSNSPNCDASNQYPKWYDLIGWQWNEWQWSYVGAYSGCAHGALFRPTDTGCKMNKWATQPFCPVCRRQILAVLGDY